MTDTEAALLVRALDGESAMRGRLAIENEALRAELGKTMALLDHATVDKHKHFAELGRLVTERARVLEQVDAILARSIELEEHATELLRMAHDMMRA